MPPSHNRGLAEPGSVLALTAHGAAVAGVGAPAGDSKYERGGPRHIRRSSSAHSGARLAELDPLALRSDVHAGLARAIQPVNCSRCIARDRHARSPPEAQPTCPGVAMPSRRVRAIAEDYWPSVAHLDPCGRTEGPGGDPGSWHGWTQQCRPGARPATQVAVRPGAWSTHGPGRGLIGAASEGSRANPARRGLERRGGARSDAPPLPRRTEARR
jgi:hypothetical protein